MVGNNNSANMVLCSFNSIFSTVVNIPLITIGSEVNVWIQSILSHVTACEKHLSRIFFSTTDSLGGGLKRGNVVTPILAIREFFLERGTLG